MAGPWRFRAAPLALALILAVFWAPGISANRRLLHGTTQQSSTCSCGQPMDQCDFYMDGYKDKCPVITFGPGSWDMSCSVMSSCCSGDSSVSCGNQFYANRNHIASRTVQGAAQSFEGLCIKLVLTQVELAPNDFNLNQGDGNKQYPEERRCVIFQTACASSYSPPSYTPPSYSPPSYSPPSYSPPSYSPPSYSPPLTVPFLLSPFLLAPSYSPPLTPPFLFAPVSAPPFLLPAVLHPPIVPFQQLSPVPVPPLLFPPKALLASVLLPKTEAPSAQPYSVRVASRLQ
ncbi:hypothetical protein KFL_000010540 [Klebsormidium nitens]|uniref:Pherophorin domain-containing protein n=1 Tax=Klebsormidium nitens TaxID=105231 RepID=A0A0U9HR27_KLENI|nr:hypothetical protein KFL_000010540 [Klebsormidium nitens]|eukprot:GAQ77605.1 hypothetical protein KFL_000010540 [Klebsormidium nitens]